MLTQFAGMAAAILVWLVAATALLGLGTAAARLCRLDRAVTQDRATTAMLGSCVWMPLAALVHFFVPLSLPVVAPFGVACFIVGMVEIVRSKADGLRLSPALAIVFGLMSLWLANQATALCGYVDNRDYHLAALRWTITYPLVPGLANLHFRLGFPSLYYGLAAVFEWWPGRGVASYFANSTLIWIGLFRAFRALDAGRSLKTLPPAHELFFIGMLPFVVVVATSEGVNNIMTDVPNYFLAMFGIAALLRLRGRADRSTTSKAAAGSWAAVAVVLTITATCVKLSGAGVAAGTLLAIGALMWRYGLRVGQRPVVVAGVWSTLAIAMLMARSFVISGYFAFPAAWSNLGLHPDFAVPPPMTSYVKMDTFAYGRTVWPGYLAKSFSKYPGPFHLLGTHLQHDLAAGNWIVPYLATLPMLGFLTHTTPLVAAAIMGVFVWWHRRRRQDVSDAACLRAAGPWWPFWLPVVVGLAFCFVTAPEIRFAAHIGWAACCLMLAWQVSQTGERRWLPGLSLPVGACVLVLVTVTYRTAWAAAIRTTRPQALFWAWSPARLGGCLPSPVGITVGEFRTDSGLALQLPDEGWPGWQPLLSIDYMEPHLALRNPADLSKGFRVSPAPDVVPPPRFSDIQKKTEPEPLK